MVSDVLRCINFNSDSVFVADGDVSNDVVVAMVPFECIFTWNLLLSSGVKKFKRNTISSVNES